jgi:hypothetical protein
MRCSSLPTAGPTAALPLPRATTHRHRPSDRLEAAAHGRGARSVPSHQARGLGGPRRRAGRGRSLGRSARPRLTPHGTPWDPILTPWDPMGPHGTPSSHPMEPHPCARSDEFVPMAHTVHTLSPTAWRCTLLPGGCSLVVAALCELLVRALRHARCSMPSTIMHPLHTLLHTTIRTEFLT